MKKFVLVGGSGFVGSRHMQAISEVGGDLLAIMDPSDSIGIVDRYFPEAAYFSSFERFDRYCNRWNNIDFVSICSPNHTHDFYCRFALKLGAAPICEKPLVLRNQNLIELLLIEHRTEKKIWNILQLRLSDVYKDIQEHLKVKPVSPNSIVTLDYHAPRGKWYDYSWKSDEELSGGLEFNIGIHLVDLLCQLFGNYELISVYDEINYKRHSFFEIVFDKCSVEVDLSIDAEDEGRVLTIDGKSFDLTKNMKNLHTRSYEEIMKGNGFGIEEVRQSIQLCEELSTIRNERRFSI